MRLATYNLLHGIDVRQRGRIDIAAAAGAIAALDADVVALQEVDRGLDRSERVDQARWIGERLGFDAAFAPALLGSPDRVWVAPNGDDPGGPAYGVAVLSRWPLRTVWRTPLPGGGDGHRRRAGTPQRPGWDREPRVALHARVASPEGEVTVTTTHLSYLPWRGVLQLRTLARTAHAPRAAIVGDLNLPPGAVAGVARGWHLVRAGPTYPSWDPRVQVDHALIRGLTARSWELPPETSSDHRPLVVDVEST